MPLSLKSSIYILMLTSPFISSPSLGADHKCSDCHKSTSPNISDLIKPLSTLCSDCHAARITRGEHAVDIPLSTTMPKTNIVLPLQKGKLTCITCHDPHKAALALRLTDPDLCRQCHNR